jgi:homoserine dehydrogenase
MYVAIMGYGVVGSGVAELFNKNHESIVKKSTQSQLELKYILDLRDFKGDTNEKLMVKDFNIILNDPDVGIVVETMGGLHPAFDYVLACLKAGKSVVTSNKELVAAKGYELLRTATAKKVNFLFEASVGGGSPIIRPISQCLAANEINEIAGILNGTTNFILTMMIEHSMSFEDALKLAQDNGYAEKDPTADIEGLDACRKICILASLCFGKHVYPDSVYTQGISKITLEDVEYARNWGGVIKLIGRAVKLSDNRISAMVSPCIVQRHSQLAGVDDVFNAILVRGDAIGDVVFYGRGAGKMPTASAVVADVIDCAKHVEKKKLFGWDDSEDGYVSDYLDVRTALYIRAKAENRALAIDAAQKVFGEIKQLSRENAPAQELAFVTPSATERELMTRLETLHAIEPLSIIRISDY